MAPKALSLLGLDLNSITSQGDLAVDMLPPYVLGQKVVPHVHERHPKGHQVDKSAS